MIKKCCAFLSALMIILFSTFSQYAAIPTYAAMDPRYYVAAGPLIASIFTAYGYKRNGTNSVLADLVAECVVDAADAGYTTVRNGVESCGIAISDGVSYCKKDFLDWVYSWCNQHNMSSPQVDGSFTYPSYSVDETVNFQPYTGDWHTYASSCGFPAEVLTEFNKYSSSLSNRNMYSCAFSRTEYTTGTKTSYSTYKLGYSNIPAGNRTIERYTRNGSIDGSEYSYSYLHPSGYRISSGCFIVEVYDNGDIKSVSDSNAANNIGASYSYSYNAFIGPGVYGPYTYTYTGYPCTFNVTYTAGSAGYEVSDDAPSTTKTFTEYVSNPASWEGLNSWGGKEKNVNIDGTNTTGMPITIPIDIIIDGQQIGAAVADIVAGAQAAVNAALAMTQQVAREGTITEAAEGELEEANTAVENTMEVAEAQPIVNDILGWGIDYIKPHLSNVFQKYPFSIPYDFYLILNALYSGANRPQRLRAMRVTSSSGDGPINENPSNVGIDIDFEYVSKENSGSGSVSENDPNAPKFDYDFYIAAFDKQYHFVGTLDFAPFGGLIKLCKLGIGLLWLCTLLLWNYNHVYGGNGGKK